MAEDEPGSANITPMLKIPVLTEAEKRALFEQPNHGIQPAPEIRRFKDFDEWMQRGGAANNFWQRFAPDFLYGMHREMQCNQRFQILYPELDAELGEAANHLAADPHHKFDEATDEKFFDAYGKLADLVDVHDARINNNLPEG